MSNNKFKILIIEDEANIRSFIETIFTSNNYKVILADNYSKGKMMYFSYLPDLVILDLGLPDKDGIHLLKEIRNSSSTPIIVLSARTDETEKVLALDLGANDYVTKPFGTDELLARVRVAIRNGRGRINNNMLENKRTFGDLTIDYDKRIIFIDEKEIKLTQTEYNIIIFLSDHVGKVMTYSNIIEKIWGEKSPGSIKKLQVNMANIRKKFNSTPGENKYIINELGVGYRMIDESEKSAMY